MHWYPKLVVLLTLAYFAFPIDLITDGLMFFGQIDDLIVVRFAMICKRPSPTTRC